MDVTIRETFEPVTGEMYSLLLRSARRPDQNALSADSVQYLRTDSGVWLYSKSIPIQLDKSTE